MRIVFILILLAMAPRAPAQDVPVDFRYAPPRWLTPLGLPDDWHKSLLDEQGALAYDFGPGPYVRPGTTVRLGVRDAALAVTAQRMDDPRVPVVRTTWEGAGVRMRQDAFTLVPEVIETAVPGESRVQRTNGLVGTVAWATPDGEVDPAFRNVAWGTGRAIRYAVAVEPGSRKRVALGFCDSYRTKGTVKRLMDVRVEGAPPRTIDLLAMGDRNEPHALFFDGRDEDGDGRLRVEVAASPSTHDPNVLLNALWVFPPDADIEEADVVSGAATAQAEVYVDAGQEPQVQQRSPRIDALLATFEGASATPLVEVASRRRFSFDEATGVLRTDGRPFLASRPAPVSARQVEGGWVLELPAGTRQAEVIVLHGYRVPEALAAVPDLTAARARAQRYWVEEAGLPWDRIVVPDAGIQALLAASIRTLYQVREVVDGLPQFQPGATVYRGLWAGDGMWMVDAAALLGDTEAARRMVEAMMRHQQADGRFVVMSPPRLLRETAHVMWAMHRYARLAGDRAFLQASWPRMERAMAWLVQARAAASSDTTAPYYGLMPPGLTDGGVGGINPEYSSVYWGLIGMHTAMEAARWLGRTGQAVAWQREYADFMAAYRRAAARDSRQDGHGNWFVPMRMNYDPAADRPQQGQAVFFHSVFPGKLFDSDDTLVRSTMRAASTDTAQGLVVGSGWLAGGVWPYNAANRAQAALWVGEVAEAQRALYAFARHAAPTFVWVEEQMPQGQGRRTAGDVPHANANAQFVRLLRHLLVLERGRRLELLHGLPAAWLAPGATLRLDAIPTEFGPLTLVLEMADDGAAGTITIAPLGAAGAAGGPFLCLKPLRQRGFTFPDGRPLPDWWGGAWGQPIHLSFQQ